MSLSQKGMWFENQETLWYFGMILFLYTIEPFYIVLYVS